MFLWPEDPLEQQTFPDIAWPVEKKKNNKLLVISKKTNSFQTILPTMQKSTKVKSFMELLDI